MDMESFWRSVFRLRTSGVLLAVLWGATFGAVAGSADARPRASVLTGRIRHIHVDDFRHGRSSDRFFLQVGGDSLRLVLRRRQVTLRSGTLVQVRGYRHGDRIDVESGPNGVRRLRATPRARLVAAGPHKVAVILFNFGGTTGPGGGTVGADTSQPWTAAQAQSIVFGAPNSVSNYFREESGGSLWLTGSQSASGDVFGWYTLSLGNTTCDPDAWASAAQAAAARAGVDLTPYDHLVYAFPWVSSCGWSGLGEMPGVQTWINDSLGLRVVGHELGHNLGFDHASSYRCVDGSRNPVAISQSCTRSEYGDPFDIMGWASTRHTNNFHLGLAGWLTGANIQTVTNEGTYTFATPDLLGSGVQLLRIPRTSTTVYDLEIRRPYGTYFDDFASTDPAVNGVTIRLDPTDLSSTDNTLLIDTTPSTATFSDAALAPGQIFTDPNPGGTPISITTQAVTALGATVQIQHSAIVPSSPPASAASAATGAVAAGPGVVHPGAGSGSGAGATPPDTPAPPDDSSSPPATPAASAAACPKRGAARKRCQARHSYKRARARCARLSRNRRAACRRSAKRAYAARLTAIRCASARGSAARRGCPRAKATHGHRRPSGRQVTVLGH
jgi:hypothetical protein